MARYHVNERGEAGMCRARKACPFGDLTSDHYSSLGEARAAYEASMGSIVFAKPTPLTLTTEAVARMDEEVQRLLVGAIKRVLKEENPFIENQTAYWQAAYDSTAAGELWLERRGKEKHWSEKEHPEVTERRRNVAEFLASVNENPMDLTLPTDPGDVFEHDFSTEEDSTYPDRFDMGDEKVKLALLSGAWMSQLTPQEIEAVSWVTSNGASVMNQHLSGKEPEIWGYDTYPREFIDQQIAYFRSAMAKAPELDEPIIIYRGTGSEFANFEYLDRPASASLAGSVARGFANGEGEAVVLEIKTTKVPSVAGMSAWGVSELEVLAPLGKYRKVGEFSAIRGRKNRRTNRHETDPDFDRVRIIQLEYLGTE